MTPSLYVDDERRYGWTNDKTSRILRSVVRDGQLEAYSTELLEKYHRHTESKHLVVNRDKSHSRFVTDMVHAGLGINPQNGIIYLDQEKTVRVQNILRYYESNPACTNVEYWQEAEGFLNYAVSSVLVELRTFIDAFYRQSQLSVEDKVKEAGEFRLACQAALAAVNCHLDSDGRVICTLDENRCRFWLTGRVKHDQLA